MMKGLDQNTGTMVSWFLGKGEVMYCVYWMLRHDAGWVSNHQIEDDLTTALQLCAHLRKEPDVRFVTMAVENPNMVGKMGVDVTGPDYDWVKRRDAISVRKKGIV